MGFIEKELAHGTGVLLDWKTHCRSGAKMAMSAIIAMAGPKTSQKIHSTTRFTIINSIKNII